MSAVTSNASVEVINFLDQPGNSCSCGVSHRAWSGADEQPLEAQFNRVFFNNAQSHFHRQAVETYGVFDVNTDSAIELDGEVVLLKPLDYIIIKPGCTHRAIGNDWSAVLCVTGKHCRYDQGDMWLKDLPPAPESGTPKRWELFNLADRSIVHPTFPVSVRLLEQPAGHYSRTQNMWHVLLVPADSDNADLTINGCFFDLRPGTICRVPPNSEIETITDCRVIKYTIPRDSAQRVEAFAFRG